MSSESSKPKVFDELSCAHIPVKPRDPKYVPTCLQPKHFSSGITCVGEGRFSRVFKATLSGYDDELECVLKVLKKNDNIEFQKQVDILAYLGNHPNVIFMAAICDFGAGNVNAPFFDRGVVMPWYSGGSLQEFVKRYPDIISDDKSLRNLLLGVCRGVEAVHKKKVVHRDIACRNFLVSPRGRIILSDFGLSRRLEKDSTSIDEPEKNYQYLYYEGGGVLPFRSVAPESLSSLKFTMRSDIWSLGVLAIDLATRCQSTPFGHIRSPVELGIAFATNPNLPTDQLPSDCPLILRYFVETCCNMAPELRPPIEKLVEAAWTPNMKLQSMMAGNVCQVPPVDELKEPPEQPDAERVFSPVSTSMDTTLRESCDQALARGEAETNDANLEKTTQSDKRNSVLSLQEVLRLGTVLRQHKFDESLFTLLTNEDMNELHSHLENASDLKASIRALREKYETPRESLVPFSWWKKRLAKKKSESTSTLPIDDEPLEEDLGKPTSGPAPCNVSLFGAAHAGKTILRHYILEHYGAPLDASIRERFILPIYCRIVECMQVLVHESTDQEVLRRFPMSDKCRDAAKLISITSISDYDKLLDANVVNAIKELWAHEGTKACFENPRGATVEPSLDNMSHFFDNIDAIADESQYVPSFDEALRIHIRTHASISKVSIVFEGVNIQLYDVCGVFKVKWRRLVAMEHKAAVIYVVALSEYDVPAFGDHSESCMTDSIHWFEKLASASQLTGVPFLLLFTKEKLFRAKLKRVPLTVCFPEYQGPNDYESALEFIKHQYLQHVSEEDKLVHIHVTDMLDSREREITVWNMLKEIVASMQEKRGSP